jgi:hypothetical protein
VVDPGHSTGYIGLLVRFVDHEVFFEIDAGRRHAFRVLVESQAGYEMRLESNVTDIVVITAGTWVGPIDDFGERLYAGRFLGQLPIVIESCLQS